MSFVRSRQHPDPTPLTANYGFGLDFNLPARVEQRRNDDHARRWPHFIKDPPVHLSDGVGIGCRRQIHPGSDYVAEFGAELIESVVDDLEAASGLH